jgi:2-hydroxy-3-keto-5-methylthiopentenyl-1-phosphate phosphatase
MTPPAIPELRPGDPPLAILIDYDGTVSLTDVTEQLLAEFVSGVVWEDAEASYDAGRMGSRRLMAWEVSLIDADPDTLRATAAAQPHDHGFVGFVRRAQAAGIPLEIVSDGYGFFIQPALDALGVGEIPIVTARTTFDGRRARIEFPNGHPTCLVCGTCKRQRVLAYRASGRQVVYIGDGESDRYAGRSAAGPRSRRSSRGSSRRSRPGAPTRRSCSRSGPGRRHRAATSAVQRCGATASRIRRPAHGLRRMSPASLRIAR